MPDSLAFTSTAKFDESWNQEEEDLARAPRKKAARSNMDPIIEAGMESFPASDPPAWISAHVGKPVKKSEPVNRRLGIRDRRKRLQSHRRDGLRSG